MSDPFLKAQRSKIIILELGKTPGEEEKRATCRGCGTKIKFRPKDVERVHDQRDGDYFNIPCPLCDMQIIVAVR